MWTEYLANTLPNGQTPLAHLHRVLPRAREPFQHHLQRAEKCLSDNTFDPSVSLFLFDDRGPVGLCLLSGEGDKRNIDLLAVRGDRHRNGIGKHMLSKVIKKRPQSIQTLTASHISSANTAAVHLLTSASFIANPTGGIRMCRSLNAPLPIYQEPQGIVIRALKPGEEMAWVELKNACFVGDGGRAWEKDDFHKEFTQSPIFDWSRIFVALENGQMVATTTAWEANYGDGPVGLIHWVGTRPECRGKGVGYAINLRALEELAALGYAEAWLNTARWRAPAVRLYERQGFHIHREMVNYTRNF